MVRSYDNKPTSSASAVASDERISVIKLSKSGGCVDRDAAYMKYLREAQIREYFFGNAISSTASSALSLSSTSSTSITLSPHAQQLDFDSLAVYNITVVTPDEEEDEYDPSQFGASDAFLPGGMNDTETLSSAREERHPYPRNRRHTIKPTHHNFNYRHTSQESIPPTSTIPRKHPPRNHTRPAKRPFTRSPRRQHHGLRLCRGR
jgi:Pre-mRNA cleavage and polyadenylation factor IA/II complex, subunit CLP1